MPNSKTEIDSWLMTLSSESQSLSNETWDAGFDADRQIIHSKFGPYSKLFLRPE